MGGVTFFARYLGQVCCPSLRDCQAEPSLSRDSGCLAFAHLPAVAPHTRICQSKQWLRHPRSREVGRTEPTAMHRSTSQWPQRHTPQDPTFRYQGSDGKGRCCSALEGLRGVPLWRHAQTPRTLPDDDSSGEVSFLAETGDGGVNPMIPDESLAD